MPDEKLSNEFLAVTSPLIDAAFDTLSLLADREFKTESGNVSSPSAEELDNLIADYQIAVRVPLSKEAFDGEMCILVGLADATIMADLLNGGEGSSSEEWSDESEKALQTGLDQMIAAAETGLKNAMGESFSLGSPAIVKLMADSDTLSDLKDAGVACAEFKIVCDKVLDSNLFVVTSTDTVTHLFEEAAPADAEAVSEDARPATIPESGPSDQPQLAIKTADVENIDLILDVQLSVVARLGRVEMPISEVLALGPGAIIEVGHSVEEPVELFVNEKLVARGEVVVVDEKFGLRITEIVSPTDRVKSLR